MKATDEQSIQNELNEAREWFADRYPKGYIISYYLDSECVGSETVEA